VANYVFEFDLVTPEDGVRKRRYNASSIVARRAGMRCERNIQHLTTSTRSLCNNSRDVLPRDELDEVLVERDAGFRVEDGAEGRRDEVRRDDGIFRVAEDALETSLLTGRLHRRLDLVVRRLRH